MTGSILALWLLAFVQEPPPAEPKPAQEKPAQTKPAEQKPAEAKEAEKSVEPKEGEKPKEAEKPPEPKEAEAKATEAKQTETKAAAPAAAETPAAADAWLTGSVDVGYRWRLDPGGNPDVYRSIVDLGSGLKLLGADFTILDPKRKLFDRLDARASNWGDDPYTTLNVTARKAGVYDFVSSYRNLAYFNNIPSFANPLLNQGVLTSQRAFDTRSRISSFELNLRPGHWFVPYLAYDRSSGYGNGVTTFVADQNEYAVPDRMNYSQNNFRGGVRFELRRAHLTIEQGGTTFRDDEFLYQAQGVANSGNRLTPYLGRNLYLTGLSQATGVRGSSVYTKALGTAEVKNWLSLHGQFLFAQPQNDANYQQFNTGSFVLPSQLFFFTSQQYLLSSASKVPHRSWNAGGEVKLHPRLRVMTSWMSDVVQISGINTGQQLLTNPPATRTFGVADSSALRYNYNHVDTDIFWDVTSQLTLRGGYRYVWGDTTNYVLPPMGLASFDMANLSRNIGKAGFIYRWKGKLNVNADIEAAGTNQAYYRTSLSRYQRARAQASYQLSTQFSFLASFSALNNENPTPTIDYSYLGMQASASLLWNASEDKPFGFQGTYTRASIRSDIGYLIPQLLTTDQSRYRDNSHSIQGLFDVRFRRTHGRLTAGGSFFLSSGSRPTNYFVPTGKLVLPLTHGLAWVSEWSYYGYSESFYYYEGFRTHLITTGLRFSR